MRETRDAEICTFEHSKRVSNINLLRVVGTSLARMICRLTGDELINPRIRVRAPEGDFDGYVEVSFDCWNMEATTFDMLSTFTNKFGANEFYIEVEAKESVEDYRKNHNWFKKDKEKWEKIKDYKYDGYFEVKLTYYLNSERWKEVTGE